jgi:hypothetical protein
VISNNGRDWLDGHLRARRIPKHVVVMDAKYRNVYACDVSSFFSIVSLIKQNFRANESKVVDEDFNASVLICC